MWQLRIGRDRSAAVVPRENQGVPDPQQIPQHGAPVPGREVSAMRVPTLAVKTHEDGI